MATPKTETQVHQHTITATFTDEEYELLEAFAAEQEIDNLSEAIPALLHELIRLSDALWDALFEISTKPLDEMARKALEDDRAGLTEDFDPNSDSS
ncbi:MAG TPA: hypothetical protein VHD90_10235 [Phototrophicaceae bacterium]|nr:hypothetical protein [Phototrophicaceae bacterium]